MILEIAILNVVKGREGEFKDAFEEAKGIIAGMPGFVALELRKCVERNNQYVLLVRSQTLEDRTVGFRNSPEYARWRDLLHRFFDPFPEVTVDERNGAASRSELFGRVYQALIPNGFFLFDMAGPKRAPMAGPAPGFTEGPGWTVLLDIEVDVTERRLTHHITSFRQVGELYRRDYETIIRNSSNLAKYWSP